MKKANTALSGDQYEDRLIRVLNEHPYMRALWESFAGDSDGYEAPQASVVKRSSPWEFLNEGGELPKAANARAKAKRVADDLIRRASRGGAI